MDSGLDELDKVSMKSKFTNLMQGRTHGDLKVLIVDDDETFLILQKNLLKDAGFSVEALSDPSQVIQGINQYKPDLLVLDKVMSIDGFYIAQLVRDNFTYLPIIIISADKVEQRDLKTARALGCIDCLSKDIADNQYIKKVTRYCYIGKLSRCVEKLETTMNKNIKDMFTVFFRDQ